MLFSRKKSTGNTGGPWASVLEKSAPFEMTRDVGPTLLNLRRLLLKFFTNFIWP
jgi:hypothetical protein